MAATYSIDDGESNQITTGLQEHQARAVAQRIANERGESVYLYTGAEPYEKIAPEMSEQRAAEQGSSDGVEDVETVLEEQGLNAVRATLAPGHLEWDGGAINAGAADFAGVPEALRAVYYEAYRVAARKRAEEIVYECR